MIGAKGPGKFLNSKGSRSSVNATFFEYFLDYFVKIYNKMSIYKAEIKTSGIPVSSSCVLKL